MTNPNEAESSSPNKNLKDGEINFFGRALQQFLKKNHDSFQKKEIFRNVHFK